MGHRREKIGVVNTNRAMTQGRSVKQRTQPHCRILLLVYMLIVSENGNSGASFPPPPPILNVFTARSKAELKCRRLLRRPSEWDRRMRAGPWVTSTPRAAPLGPGVGAEPASQQHWKLTDNGCWSDKLDRAGRGPGKAWTGQGMDRTGGCVPPGGGGTRRPARAWSGQEPDEACTRWELPHEQGVPLGDLPSPLVRRLQNYEIFFLSRLCSSAVPGFTIKGEPRDFRI